MALADAIKAAAAASPMPFTSNAAPVEGRVLHVDGDYCAYYCSGSDGTSAGLARRNLLDRLDAAKRASGATSVIVHLSDAQSTKGDRYLVATTKPYQGQRNAGRKPDNWHALREFMEGYDGPAFTRKVWTTREADDGMAYCCTQVAAVTDATGRMPAVLTADKDMRMFPGIHIVWKTYQQVVVPHGTFELIGGDGKLYGTKWFWMQMLTGDTADNIPGLHLVGEVTARSMLRSVADNQSAADAVMAEYKKRHPDTWADYFVEQAVLLWMRTDRHAQLLNFANALEVDWPTAVETACRDLVKRVSERKLELEALRA